VPLRLGPYQAIPSAGWEHPFLEVVLTRLQSTNSAWGWPRCAVARLISSEEARRRASSTSAANLCRWYEIPAAPFGCWIGTIRHQVSAWARSDLDCVRVHRYLTWQERDRTSSLQALERRGWLYLCDGRGQGPLPSGVLPCPGPWSICRTTPIAVLSGILKQEGLIRPQPHIHLSRVSLGCLAAQPLPPFFQLGLPESRPSCRAGARSLRRRAARLAGWKGPR